ncbi:hypothetical protein [Synechococcus sp. O70.1]|uniref:hypothetical protein n=1 Tax=Synechococcus sp. O70.1 TaxID=2964535 RepID=UPI0039C09FDE
MRGSLVLLLCLSLALGGCSQLARLGLGITPIAQIEQDPSRYANVYVRGRVVNQIGAFGQGVYEIQDHSGSLWVLTDKGLPAMNSTITVRGKVQEGILLAGRRFGVSLVEVERF